MNHPFDPTDRFENRHLGSGTDDRQAMLQSLGVESLDDLTDQVVPETIRLPGPLHLPDALAEHEALDELRALSDQNQVFRSHIGTGYYGTVLPAAIRRNILENPGWYTQYTPYQAEISQGRLEALMNFQTMVADLTGLPMANASLLDEATAAAEAMAMTYAVARGSRNRFIIADDCHPQTIAVCKTRAWSMGITLDVIPAAELTAQPFSDDLCGVLIQYPNTYGAIQDHAALAESVHAAGALLVVATDLLALTLIAPPGQWGGDIAVGSAQRLGFPMGCGGPHAAFIACNEKHVRKMPGRIVGLSIDAQGNPAYRLAIQTREQHIKRDKATSNICTAQVLLAIIASIYAVYHGPQGLRNIADRIARLTACLAAALQNAGVSLQADRFFDTLTLTTPHTADILSRAKQHRVNLRTLEDNRLAVSLDETTSAQDARDLYHVITGQTLVALPAADAHTPRPVDYLTHPVFNSYHTEHELLRYIKRLEGRDLTLNHSA